MRAYVPSALSCVAYGLNLSSLTEFTVCSTLTIVYPSFLSLSTAIIVSSQYSHPTLSSAPSPDLWISADGGTGHIPHRKTLSTLNESDVLNTDPTLWALLTLSSTTTMPESGSSLYFSAETRPSSMFRSLRSFPCIRRLLITLFVTKVVRNKK